MSVNTQGNENNCSKETIIIPSEQRGARACVCYSEDDG